VRQIEVGLAALAPPDSFAGPVQSEFSYRSKTGMRQFRVKWAGPARFVSFA
jgi:hypothetical protein